MFFLILYTIFFIPLVQPRSQTPHPHNYFFPEIVEVKFSVLKFFVKIFCHTPLEVRAKNMLCIFFANSLKIIA